jgi:mRNA interferase HigB
MHVISYKALKQFWRKHPDAKIPLKGWYKRAVKAEWRKFADVRQSFPSADQVKRFVVFNIGGNNYRLITAIHYNRLKVYIRHVLTHGEYDEEDWKND